MSYTPNVPTIGQSLGASRPIINSNFQYINTWAGTNHYFNASNGGRHKFVEMPVLSVVPASGNRISGEATLYTRTVDTVNQLFMARGTSSTEIQITAGPNAPVNSTDGWTFLPTVGVAGTGANGLILQWGSVANPGTSGTINFPIAFGFNAYSVMLTPRNDGSHSAFTYYLDGTPGASSFGYRGSTGGSNRLFWMAIGAL